MACQQTYMTKAHPPAKTPNLKAIAVGRRIADKREQKGYTQATLAARINVTGGAVAQYETGRTIPRTPRLERIALELDTSMDYLLTGGDPDQQGRAQTRTELEALLLLRTLPVAEQETVMAMLEGLASRSRVKKP
jgi:transcriptional regulator with XRE-family HTH domain